jgi:hypothetical protein
MLFKQFREKRRARKERLRADREVASRVMDGLDKGKGKSKSGFDWKTFLFGSNQKKQHVVEQCTQTVEEVKQELAKLKAESNKEYDDLEERARKKAELLQQLAALRARVIKREKKVQQIDLQQDASQEYLVAISKKMHELEEYVECTEADLEHSQQAGPDGSIFYLVGKSDRDLQKMTGLRTPEAIRAIKDTDSYEYIEYFSTGGVELNEECAAAIRGTMTTKLSDLATKQAGGPNLVKRKEVIAKILKIPFDPHATTDAEAGSGSGFAAMPAAASKKRDFDDVDSCGSDVTASSDEEGGSRPPKMLKTNKD